MSLFPAYDPKTSSCNDNEQLCSNNSRSSESKNNTPDLSWLQNSSYFSLNKDGETSKESSSLINPDDAEKVISAVKKKKKKKKDKKEKLLRETKPESRKTTGLNILESDSFYEDKTQERGNFLVSTLHRPAIPRYNKDDCYFKDYKYLMKNLKEKKRKTRRYFTLKSSKIDTKEVYDNDQSVQEEELTRVTEDFNKRLASNPKDVDVWLEYVHFQDTVYDFEKAYRKNAVGGDKVTNDRKLSILERALHNNPASQHLLEKKLELCEQVWPADQLASECERELIQDPSNLVLWRSLIHTTKNNMARCTAPGVQQLYTKAMSRVNQLRLHRSAVSVEQDILALLLESGLFLQQAGLWEQLWTLLQMYLSLSLTASGHFDVPFTIEDNKLS